MKAVETGTDKVKKICEALKKETIDPAKKEADAIVHRAREEAARLIEEAKEEAKEVLREAKEKIQEERSVFQSSIHLAAKKSIAALKEEIEEKLFSRELSEVVKKAVSGPEVVAKLISAIVKGIEEEGIKGDLRAFISKEVSVQDVNACLAEGILERLKGKSVEVGEVKGGAEVKIVDQNITIDMSDEALKALLAKYIQEDFREIIFSS
jgi:V/A-type H+-transporting ATPase subunit E